MAVPVSSLPTALPTWNTARQKAANFFKLSGLFVSKPAHWASEIFCRDLCTAIRPGIEGNLPYYSLEVIRRIFVQTICVIPFLVSDVLALCGAGIERLGDLIVFSTPYTYFRGLAKEKSDSDFKSIRLMTQNGCMFWGGMPIPFGGMHPPSQRIDGMSQRILEGDPDVLVMQEEAFGPGCQLYEKLKHKYAHFYVRIAPNSPSLESCLFVASKYPVLNTGFIPFSKNCLQGVKRGAFWIETPHCFVFTTHLQPGDETSDEEERTRQFDMVGNQIDVFKKKKPCFLLGDFNSKSLEVEGKFHDPYRKKYPTSNEESSTCTNVIRAYVQGKKPPERPWERVDYALLAKGEHDAFTLDVEKVIMYDNDKPNEALSDHHGLLLTATPC